MRKVQKSKLQLLKLKIKVKSLAEEARIIRKEEQRLKKQAGRFTSEKPEFFHYHTIRSHRHWDVRNEARATQLAIAFIKGYPYSRVERKVKDKGHQEYIGRRVAFIVCKYGKMMYNIKQSDEDFRQTKKDIQEWMNEQS